LDFFVTNDPEYTVQVKQILTEIENNGFLVDAGSIIKSVNFNSLKVYRKDDASGVRLKLDFVNDLVPHFGELQKTALFDRTDSIRNILSNKLSALFRYAAKDIADIREIVLHGSVDWAEIIGEARQKEAGLEIPLICEILSGMPEVEFNTVKWAEPVAWPDFKKDIEKIVFDMISGQNAG
jgi:hypothetical protein